jgi:hypothetical protein
MLRLSLLAQSAGSCCDLHHTTARCPFAPLPTSDCLSSLMAGELGLSAKDHAPRLCPLAALPQHQTTMRRRGIGPNISKRFVACLLQDAVRTCAERLEPPALGFFTPAVNAAFWDALLSSIRWRRTLTVDVTLPARKPSRYLFGRNWTANDLNGGSQQTLPNSGLFFEQDQGTSFPHQSELAILQTDGRQALIKY